MVDNPPLKITLGPARQYPPWRERGDVIQLRVEGYTETAIIHPKFLSDEFYVRLLSDTGWMKVTGFCSAQLKAVELITTTVVDNKGGK